MNVSGIIESSASTVAKAVPNRIPRYAGMKKSRMPTIEMPTVDHAMNVWIGVKPLVTLRWKRSARYDREPAEPVRPGRHAVDVLGRPGPLLPIGRGRVGRRPARPLGHHRRQLRKEQTEQVPRDCDDDDHRDRRSSQRRHHDRRDSRDEDRSGEADHECSPPVRLLFQATACVVQLVLVRRQIGPP